VEKISHIKNFKKLKNSFIFFYFLEILLFIKYKKDFFLKKLKTIFIIEKIMEGIINV